MDDVDISELLPSLGMFPIHWCPFAGSGSSARKCVGLWLEPDFCLFTEGQLCEKAWLLIDGCYEVRSDGLRLRAQFSIDADDPLLMGLPDLTAHELISFGLTTVSPCIARAIDLPALAGLLASDFGACQKILSDLGLEVRKQRRMYVRGTAILAPEL